MRKLLIPLMMAISAWTACKKKDSPLVLEKTQLVSPAQNEVCTSGAVVNTQQTRITFNWSATTAAETYTLVLKNLLEKTEEKTGVVGTSVVLTLLRNTPYAWHIIARSAKAPEPSTSDSWKFYVAGNGTISYAPFPAELTSPKYAETVNGNTVSLTWKGNDVDNDIVAYDVYLGIGTPSSTPPLLQANVKDQFVHGIPMTTKDTNYVWKIVTRDAAGNTSTSETFLFKMK